MKKKNNEKRNRILLMLIMAILVIALISTIIMQNIIVNRKLEEAKYLAIENTNSELLAKYIQKGITIGGITGTLESLDTSDATATPEKLFKGETAYVNGVKITGTYDPTEKKVTIPKGFYYVGGTIEDGIVISDEKADENKYAKENHADQANIPADGLIGNQFVWVPVEYLSEFTRYKSYYNGLTQDISSYYEPSQENYRYPNELEEYNSMMKSVEENHGFYVARFEAGKENVDGVDIVVSKKNADVWNNIVWGTSMTEIGTEGAVAKAKGMYTNKTTHNVTSTLIYGTQWDAIMAWIDPAYKTSTCESDSVIINSTGKGNYSGNLAKCGSSDDYRIKNIYDLAGNVYEWTMEATGAPHARSYRGGSYGDTGSRISISSRIAFDPGNSLHYYGFRPVLLL